MPWVWSDDVAARWVDAGLVDPEQARLGAHPPVALAVDDPDDLAGLGQRFFETEDDTG